MEDFKFILIPILIVIIVLGVAYSKKTKAKSRDVADTPAGFSVNIKNEEKRKKILSAYNMALGTPYAGYLKDNIAGVKDDILTRVYANNKPAIIGFTDKYISDSSLKWLASVFIHEARHVEQRHGDVNIRDDIHAELDANRIQVDVLRYLGEHESVINTLAQAEGNHFDSNGNGVLDSQDNWGY